MITALDHIVLAVDDIDAACAFYGGLLGMTVVAEPGGKVVLRFGTQQINLQPAQALPEIAQRTARGGANVCLLSDEDPTALAARLRQAGVTMRSEVVTRHGAAGQLTSVYVDDPDGNLVEISKPV